MDSQLKVLLKIVLSLVLFVVNSEEARILAIFPTPSISHQASFRPFTQELLKRGHELVIITPDPAYGDNVRPTNLTEIDVHDVSYSIFRKEFTETLKGINDVHKQVHKLVDVLTNVFETQLQSAEVQMIIKKMYKFDLVISEAYYRSAAFFANIYKVPAILLSSFGFSVSNPEIIGAPAHPLYPINNRQRIFNLTIWEQVVELFTELYIHWLVHGHEAIEAELLNKYVKEDTPSVLDVFGNVNLMLLNVHSLWEMNRPVPPSAMCLGLPELNPRKELPQDIQTIMNTTENGVIYVSFGTNVIESLLPMEKMNMFAKVFSKLKYDVIWKWSSSHLPKSAKNIKFFNWLPQSDLLRHPQLKLFLTQGGIQSSFEAIAAGVPMIGFPLSLDQGFNTELYTYYKIGLKMNFETITEEELEEGILTVIENERYRRNVATLRSSMYDQRQGTIDRAVWWTEHILRHGGNHLRSPAANMPWTQYYEIHLVLLVLIIVTVGLSITIWTGLSAVSYLKVKKFKL